MFGMNIKEIDATTLKNWIAEGKALRLVDVRTPAEMNRGMIEGGVALPMHMVPINPPRPEGDETLVIYCRSGARSAQVCAYLAQQFGTEAYNLQGGVIAWASIGESLITPEAGIMAG